MSQTLPDVEIKRYQTLREKSLRGEPLGDAEAAELSELARRWDEADALWLAQATVRAGARGDALTAKKENLRVLLEQKRTLLARMEATLAELRDQQRGIDAEIARLLTPLEFQETQASIR